jgi:hypothetical protein
MARTRCLAGIDNTTVPMLSAVLKAVGETQLVAIAPLDVSELGRIAPDPTKRCSLMDCSPL